MCFNVTKVCVITLYDHISLEGDDEGDKHMSDTEPNIRLFRDSMYIHIAT